MLFSNSSMLESISVQALKQCVVAVAVVPVLQCAGPMNNRFLCGKMAAGVPNLCTKNTGSQSRANGPG